VRPYSGRAILEREHRPARCPQLLRAEMLELGEDEEQDRAAVRELGRHLRCSHDSQAIEARVALLLPTRR
jgi:hypothetical protein